MEGIERGCGRESEEKLGPLLIRRLNSRKEKDERARVLQALIPERDDDEDGD